MRLPVGRVGVCFDSISVALLCVCVCYFYTTDFFFQFWFVGRKLTGSLTGFVFFLFLGRFAVAGGIGRRRPPGNSEKFHQRSNKKWKINRRFDGISYVLVVLWRFHCLLMNTFKMQYPKSEATELQSVKLGKTR